MIVGAATARAAVPEPGVVEERERGGVVLASLGGLDTEPIAQALRRAGFPTLVADDAASVRWSALLADLPANATSAILDVTPRDALRDGRVAEIERRAVLEAARVMARAGIAVRDLPGRSVRGLLRALRLPGPVARALLRRRARSTEPSSLWRDLASGRGITEVGWLHGAVMHYGRAAGVPTPTNRALAHLVAGIAGGSVAWEAYRANPDRVVADVTAA